MRLLSDQPLARAPWTTLYSGAQGYNGHVEYMTYVTDQIGQGDELYHP
jgi:hypothetical protein